MRLIGGTGSSEGRVRLPPGYALDRSDPDVLALLCPRGAVLARFGVRGAAAEVIEREAWAHHRERNRPAWGKSARLR